MRQNIRFERVVGKKKKQQLLSAYLLLSPAHSTLIKHHGDVHENMNIMFIMEMFSSSWRWREMNPVCLGLTITL